MKKRIFNKGTIFDIVLTVLVLGLMIMFVKVREERKVQEAWSLGFQYGVEAQQTEQAVVRFNNIGDIKEVCDSIGGIYFWKPYERNEELTVYGCLYENVVGITN